MSFEPTKTGQTNVPSQMYLNERRTPLIEKSFYLEGLLTVNLNTVLFSSPATQPEKKILVKI